MEERDANDINRDSDGDGYGCGLWCAHSGTARISARQVVKKRETDLEIIDLRVVVPSHAAVVTASTSVAAVGLFSFRSSSLD